VADKNNWKRAEKEGLYENQSLDTKGFIHCSDPSQITKVVHKNFKNKEDLEILVIDPSKLESLVKYEPSRSGDMYPHVYGPINTEAVIRTIDFSTNSKGDFLLPEDLYSQLNK
jgi:uncharacterized protein (DUF952 family)